jgi:NTE family protein
VSGVALILSGGGARGAYEVGVLSYALDHLAHVARRPTRIDLVLGTSVGAINGCFLASHMSEPVFGIRRLANLWSDVRVDEVLGFGVRQIAALPRLLRGGGPTGAGVFDVSPMARLVEREIDWRAIARALRDRRLRALSVSATEVGTGKTVLFMQTAPGVKLPREAPPRTVIRHARIGPVHALASAAIPILFPPVRMGHHLYMDGGVRQNTPIAPALRLGASHIFVIGLSRELGGLPKGIPERPPNVAFVIGKVLNAFLLDHVTSDFEVLDRVNTMIDLGAKAFGPDFLDRLNATARETGHLPYRRVQTLVVKPSQDLGTLAADHIHSSKLRAGPSLRRILALLDVGEASEADLASYLLFDGAFARKLIELGRGDAEKQASEIAAFFEDAEETARAEEIYVDGRGGPEDAGSRRARP